MKTLVLTILLIAVLCTYAGAISYELIDLSTLGGSAAHANDINNDGTIVGYANNPAIPSQNRVFSMVNGGAMTDLGVGAAEGINSFGDIVGNGSGAFLWRNGVITDLKQFTPRNDGIAFSINNSGLIVGRGSTTSGTRAFVWEGISGVFHIIPSDSWGGATDVNNNGLVVGNYNDPSGKGRGFSWRIGTSKLDIGTIGGVNCFPQAVNDLDQIVGYSTTSQEKAHPFLWQNGQMTDLGTIGDPNTSPMALDINNHGTIVGYSISTGVRQAWAWSDGSYYMLPGLGGIMTQAQAVNDSGVIAGWSITSDNQSVHAVKWVPVIPEPSSLLALCGGVAGLLAFRRRRQ